jgi:hypothetical protein
LPGVVFVVLTVAVVVELGTALLFVNETVGEELGLGLILEEKATALLKPLAAVVVKLKAAVCPAVIA